MEARLNSTVDYCLDLALLVLVACTILVGQYGGVFATRDDPFFELKEENVNLLRLQGLGLVCVPQELYMLPKLEGLYLGRNRLSNLDRLPKNMTQLTKLNLFSNQFSSLEEMPNLPQLTGLTLNGNQLQNLKGMPNMPKLQRLGLSYNQLPSLEGLPNLPQLAYLHLN